jgi:cytoskeletal protein CcmA (bactofilin family)
MWKWKEEEKTTVSSGPAGNSPSNIYGTKPGEDVPAASSQTTPKEKHLMAASAPLSSVRSDTANLGKSVTVKGEVSGSEDLYLDGEVEGTIELRGHSLVIGPNGRVRARIQARDLTIYGKLEGNVQVAERVELKKSAVVVGDIVTRRIAMEDGAFFKGGIEVQKDVKAEPAPASAPAATPVAASAAAAQQGSLLESK